MLRYLNKQVVKLNSSIVAIYGIYLVFATLLLQIRLHRTSHLTDLLVELPLLVGLSLIYLSTLLWRRKRTAWFVSILAFTFYFGLSISQLISRMGSQKYAGFYIIRSIVLPVLIVLLLYVYRAKYFVQSDIQGFRVASMLVVLMLVLAIAYGVVGFQLLDRSDFHQQLSLKESFHYTVDQFNITTQHPIHPYTKRAKLFVDSLSFVSVVAVIYAALSLFAPLRLKFADQTLAREKVKELMEKYGAESEDFFKLWPHDKQYYFDESGEAAIAYRVFHGVAIVLGDPIGKTSKFKKLIKAFSNQCTYNDWLLSFVHVSPANLNLYENLGLSVQKLGQEPFVSIEHFKDKTINSKNFRYIVNKFKKLDYKFEILEPPHHPAVINRLAEISKEWLSKGGRSERGFAMGYFKEDYLQMCPLAIARDAAGTIQAYLNIIPSSWNKTEATYDMLRFSSSSPTNAVDFLLISLLNNLSSGEIKYFNLGLCPLAGIDDSEDDPSSGVINNVFKFAFNNGDIFYSFSGLYKFKNKYEPEWRDSYVCYKGGISAFSRTMTALTRLMSKTAKKIN